MRRTEGRKLDQESYIEVLVGGESVIGHGVSTVVYVLDLNAVLNLWWGLMMALILFVDKRTCSSVNTGTRHVLL